MAPDHVIAQSEIRGNVINWFESCRVTDLKANRDFDLNSQFWVKPRGPTSVNESSCVNGELFPIYRWYFHTHINNFLQACLCFM